MNHINLLTAITCIPITLVSLFAQPHHQNNESSTTFTAGAQNGSSVVSQKKLARLNADLISLYEAMNDEENPPDESLRRQYNKLKDELARLSGEKKVIVQIADDSSHENFAEASVMTQDEIETLRKENQRVRNTRDTRQREQLQTNYEDELLIAFPDYSENQIQQLVITVSAKIKANPTAVPKDPNMLKVWKIYRKYFSRSV